MAFFKKKTAEQPQEAMSVDDVMKKFDRESNTRVWEEIPKLIVTCILATFSLFCIYVTFFATWLDEVRLTSFVAFIVFIGFLVFPAKKGTQKANYMPWYDIVMLIAGTGSFLYYCFNASEIVARFSIRPFEVIIGIVGILCLAELCRRSVGIPILCVAGALLIYALIWGSTNPSFFSRITETVRVLFDSKEGIRITPIETIPVYILLVNTILPVFLILVLYATNIGNLTACLKGKTFKLSHIVLSQLIFQKKNLITRKDSYSS